MHIFNNLYICIIVYLSSHTVQKFRLLIVAIYTTKRADRIIGKEGQIDMALVCLYAEMPCKMFSLWKALQKHIYTKENVCRIFTGYEKGSITYS